MFSLEVVDTDRFLDMPASTQALYFHLSMRADDEGFVSAPRKVIAMCNCSNDDLRILISKKYVIPFESGVCVITEWNVNNHLRNPIPTRHIQEKTLLRENNKENNKTPLRDNMGFWQDLKGCDNVSEEPSKPITLDTSPPTTSHLSSNPSSIYPPIVPPFSSSPCSSPLPSVLPSSPPSSLSSEKPKKEKPAESVTSIFDSFEFEGELKETVKDWLEYKREKRQGYKATGLKTLLGQIKRNAEKYGDEATIEVIRNSMACNYQGITFDRLKAAPVRSGDRLSWIDEVNLE